MYTRYLALEDVKDDTVFLWGARAIRNVLYPLVSSEIPDFILDKALISGMLPRHYQLKNAAKRLQAYIGDYLQEEIRAEALTRDLSTFGRFLEIAAISCGEMLNYNNIALECGVSAPTIKEYFSILEDTMIGYMIPSYKKVIKRRVIQAPRFYYFDLRITNYLLRRKSVEQGSPEYGKAFEHFIIQELYAYSHYSNEQLELSYRYYLKGLKAFKEEHPDNE